MGLKNDLAVAKRHLVAAKAQEQEPDALAKLPLADTALGVAANNFEAKKKKKVAMLLQRAIRTILDLESFLSGNMGANWEKAVDEHVKKIKTAITAVKGEAVKN